MKKRFSFLPRPVFESPTDSLSANPFAYGHIPPTRSGLNEDDKSPFVESEFETLIERIYPAYLKSRCADWKLNYAELTSLKYNGFGFPDGVDLSGTTFVKNEAFYRPPIDIENHCRQAFDFFYLLRKVWIANESDPLNEQVLRISGFDTKTNTLSIQRARYSDQVGTNLTMDWASPALINSRSIGSRPTIRNRFEAPVDGALPSLDSSILANSLGVACYLYCRTSDNQIGAPVVRIRGQEGQAIMTEGNLHCSASGVFECSDDSWGDFSAEALLQGMRNEISDEIGLEPGEYELIPLAFARELVRGGKPQMFFIAIANMNVEEVTRCMSGAKEKVEFIDPNVLEVDDVRLSVLNAFHQNATEAIHLSEHRKCFTYEGWAALRVCEAFRSGMRSI